jgi:hypothetical protein
VGGKAGSLAMSSEGGRRLVGACSELALVLVDAVWPKETVDTVDTYEMSEEFEFLLSERACPEGLRGGSAGEILLVEDRVGIGGGRTRPAMPGGSPFCERPVVVLRGNGGAVFAIVGATAMVVLFGLAGIDGLVGVVTFVSDATCRLAGRLGGGGGALLPAPGGGDWKFFCLLRAATLSARVVNCGSSTSPMAEYRRSSRGPRDSMKKTGWKEKWMSLFCRVSVFPR